jgi:hypothetical protein
VVGFSDGRDFNRRCSTHFFELDIPSGLQQFLADIALRAYFPGASRPVFFNPHVFV